MTKRKSQRVRAQPSLLAILALQHLEALRADEPTAAVMDSARRFLRDTRDAATCPQVEQVREALEGHFTRILKTKESTVSMRDVILKYLKDRKRDPVTEGGDPFRPRKPPTPATPLRDIVAARGLMVPILPFPPKSPDKDPYDN